MVFLPVFDQGQVAQRTMWPSGVVILAPGFDFLLGIMQVPKDMLVQTLFPKPAIEAFDMCIVYRLSRPNELQSNSSSAGPFIKRLTGELWPIIDLHQLGTATLFPETIQNPGNACP